jgi:hypothetical protein
MAVQPLTIGPLSLMAKSKYDYSFVQYPADLSGEGAKGHSVVFLISDIKSVPVEELGKTAVEYGKKMIQQGVGTTVLNSVEEVAASIKQVTDQGAVATFDAAANEVKKLFTDQKIPRKTVTLYMPDTMDFTQSAAYDNVSISDAIGALPLGKIGKGVNAITSFIQTNAAARLAFSKVGYTFNPQQQVLFNGIDFRSYTLQFTFTPRSAREADRVQEIIKTFRQYASPTIMTGAGGFFFTPPGIFNPTFISNGEENLKINRVTDSVLESVEVNYAPNGWSAHKDGAPVQTTMSLSFKEIILVDRTKILDGY